MILAALLLVQAAPVCTVPYQGLPAAFAHWADAPTATLAADGAPVRVAATEGAGDAAKRPGKGATLSFTIAKAGHYRLALDQKAWIDVQADGAAVPLKSIGHGHGPDCSSIAKFVTFDLAPGHYTIALSGVMRDRVKVMLISGD